MVPTTSRTTTNTNTIRIPIWCWISKTLTFYFELIMEFHLTEEPSGSSMTLTATQGRLLLDLLQMIPMDHVLKHATATRDPDHRYLMFLSLYRSDLEESLRSSLKTR